MNPLDASQRRKLFLAMGASLLASACATRPPVVPDLPAWSGRLLLRLDELPPRQFAAGFELSGRADTGLLRLSGPLGQTLAEVHWNPVGARLERGHERQAFADLDSLTQTLTGAVLPVGALFDWLAGRERPVPGWTVDASRLADGQLDAQRLWPAPPATLRIRLD